MFYGRFSARSNACSPSAPPVSPGSSVVAGVEPNAPAPDGGTVVTLSATSALGAAIDLPSLFVVRAGAPTAPVSVRAKAGMSATSETITATAGTQQLTAKLAEQ